MGKVLEGREGRKIDREGEVAAWLVSVSGGPGCPLYMTDKKLVPSSVHF